RRTIGTTKSYIWDASSEVLNFRGTTSRYGYRSQPRCYISDCFSWGHSTRFARLHPGAEVCGRVTKNCRTPSFLAWFLLRLRRSSWRLQCSMMDGDTCTSFIPHSCCLPSRGGYRCGAMIGFGPSVSHCLPQSLQSPLSIPQPGCGKCTLFRMSISTSSPEPT